MHDILADGVLGFCIPQIVFEIIPDNNYQRAIVSLLSLNIAPNHVCFFFDTSYK